MARNRQEPASGYVAPDHTVRTLAIAGGVTAAALVGLLGKGRGGKSVIERIKQSGVREHQGLQRAAKLEADAAKQSKLASQVKDTFPEFHGKTPREARSMVESLLPEHQNLMISRRHFNEATREHQKLVSVAPKMADYKYWAEPFDADHPPKPGRYLHPEVWQKKSDKFYQKTERTRRAVEIKRARAEESKKRMLENPTKVIEFDVRLKEGRGANGKFTSGGDMPPLSPRDLQYAYHAPIQRQQKQQEQPQKSGGLKKAALIGLGGVAGLAALGVAAPSLRKKILGQAIAETESVGATVGTRINRTTREGLDFAHNKETTSLKDAFQSRLAEQRAKHEQELTTRVAHHDATIKDLKEQVRVHASARVMAETVASKAQSDLQASKAVKDTAIQIAEGTAGAPPLYSETGPANVAARRQSNFLYDEHGKQIFSPHGAHKRLRESLVGRPALTPGGRPSKGKIGATQERIAKLHQDITEGPSKGMSSYQIEKLKIAHRHQTDLLATHHDLLKRLDTGAVTHIEATGRLAANEANALRKKSAQGIQDTIQNAERAAREKTKIDHAKLAQERRKDIESALPKSEPGWTGHDYHGKAPKSKNKRHFEDTRLATRLCRAVDGIPSCDLHELSSFIRDVPIKHLPANVKKDIEKFIRIKPDTHVSHYGMVADELVGKADPHNLASARVNVKKRMTVKAAADEVHSRRETKPILMMNDRIVDGHHFLAKAEHGKVSSSLHVIDLTPARFQMSALHPAMIELAG
jgi:hypothetical protein